MEQWNPLFPEFPRDMRGGQLNEREAEDQAKDTDWTAAPSSSHVHSFRFFDARASRIMRIAGVSKIQVRFKKPGTQEVGPGYEYTFTNFDQAADFWVKFLAAARPGYVVHEMSALGIPYERLY